MICVLRIDNSRLIVYFSYHNLHFFYFIFPYSSLFFFFSSFIMFRWYLHSSSFLYLLFFFNFFLFCICFICFVLIFYYSNFTLSKQTKHTQERREQQRRRCKYAMRCLQLILNIVIYNAYEIVHRIVDRRIERRRSSSLYRRKAKSSLFLILAKQKN